MKRISKIILALSIARMVTGLSIQNSKPKGNDKDTIAIKGSAKRMPINGFGTCCRKSAFGPPLVQSTKAYLAHGGRHIDTAQMYLNHWDIAKAIKESGVPREELWVTSKLQSAKLMAWPKAVVSEESAVEAVDSSLRELGLDYLDLMLIHSPEGGTTPDEQVAVWRGLLRAKEAGKVKNIGVSNFNRQQLEMLRDATSYMPVVNELEYHPWVPEETHELVKYCQKNDIGVIAYGSLGGSSNNAEGEVVSAIAKKHGVSNSQVLLRWALDKGVAIIPGATSDQHIQENLQIPKFHLDKKDLSSLKENRPLNFKAWKNCKSGCASA